MPGPDTQPNDAPPGDTAGAYGFRRREIIALIAVAVVVIAFSIVQWWRRDQALAGRQWTVSDIYVDSLLLSRADTITPPNATTAEPAGEPAHSLVDMNTASERDLIRIPGIGPALARRILVSRATDGPFASLEDVQRVHGIGPKTAARMAAWVRFSQPAAVNADTAATQQ